jgi:hypothetical protein
MLKNWDKKRELSNNTSFVFWQPICATTEPGIWVKKRISQDFTHNQKSGVFSRFEDII